MIYFKVRSRLVNAWLLPGVTEGGCERTVSGESVGIGARSEDRARPGYKPDALSTEPACSVSVSGLMTVVFFQNFLLY
jgi:hypothetical protein